MNNEEKEFTLTVKGMMCSNCEAHVKKALESIDGVISATADHKKGTVAVKAKRDIPVEVFSQAVTKAGYDFVK